MTEREIERANLIKLIDKALDRHTSTIENYVHSKQEWIADYLLENNVKPLPFKINEVVYGISRGKIIPIQIDSIQYTSRGIDICGSNEEYFGYGTIHLDINNRIGIEWYRTKEEAEQALKGGMEK